MVGDDVGFGEVAECPLTVALASPSMSAAAKALCTFSRNSLYDPMVGVSQEIMFWMKASFQALAVPFVMYVLYTKFR